MGIRVGRGWRLLPAVVRGGARRDDGPFHDCQVGAVNLRADLHAGAV
jgi:hypothetical protein